MSWLDIEDDIQLPVVATDKVVIPGDTADRAAAFASAWNGLRDNQKEFLRVWQDAGFNKSRAIRQMGIAAPPYDTVRSWNKTAGYRLVAAIMKGEAVDGFDGALERERLILRQDECVESLMTPKPILHQGLPVFDPERPGEILKEIEAGAAAKVNETMLRLGGHLKDEQEKAPLSGPALIVQVTSRETGEVVQVTAVGVTPQLPPPSTSWLDE